MTNATGRQPGSPPARLSVFRAWLDAFAFLVGVACIVLLYLVCSARDPCRIPINSDTLFYPQLLYDTVHKHMCLGGWYYGVSSCFFPDILLSGACALLWDDAILGLFACMAIQFGLLLALFAWSCRLVFGARAPLSVGLACLAGSLAIVFYAFVDAPYTTWMISYFVLPGFHPTATAMALLCLVCVLKHMRSTAGFARSMWLILLGGVSLMAAASDRLFLPQGPATVGFLLLLAAALRLCSWRAVAAPFVVSGVSAAVGMALGRLFLKSYDISVRSVVSLERMQSALATFADGFCGKLAELEPFHLLAVAWTVVGAVWVVRMVRDRGTGQDPARFLWVGWALLAGPSCVAAVILGGEGYLAVSKEYDYPTHYCIPLWLLPVLTLPAALGWWGQQRAARWPRGIAAVAALALTAAALVPPAFALALPPVRTPLHRLRPPLARFVDEIQAKHGLRFGISGYWDAIPINMFSRTGLRTAHVQGNLDPFLYCSHGSLYFGDARAGVPPPEVTFVVADDENVDLLGVALKRSRVISRFGRPDAEYVFDPDAPAMRRDPSRRKFPTARKFVLVYDRAPDHPLRNWLWTRR